MIRAITLGAAALAASALVATPVEAQEKSATKPGFLLNPGSVRIVLMRPNVRVGSQSAGGVPTPNADWTAQARANLAAALKERQGALGNTVVEYDDGGADEGPIVNQYSSLFGAVADSVIEYQFFAGNRLPTKKRKGQFAWGLGSGLARLKSLGGADYALFIDTNDEFGSTGRKMLQVVGMFAGVGITSGVHVGHAGLVDLKSGELVWLNADRLMGGDVRTPEGARKRVEQLLEKFPGRPSDAAARRAAMVAH